MMKNSLVILLTSFLFSQEYTYTKPSKDGTGKYFLGREISTIMGHTGAPWLDRSSREKEERTDLVIEALNLNRTQIVADFGAGSGYFTHQIA